MDGWRVFYDHLKPGGVITFSRWSSGAETNRLFAVAKAMLLSEGVSHPESHLAAITSGNIVTLLASNLPFSEPDLRRLREIMNEMEFKPLYLPGEGTTVPELRNILAANTLTEWPRSADWAAWTIRRYSIRRPTSSTPCTSRRCPQ